MGLPDTSPVPKKDSMGMDYIPVYADDQPDDSGAVVVSPARIQTLGVKTAEVEAARRGFGGARERPD
jgi:Cu(I)/Ag(I) efflux system membrane fusion protein